jgi:WD40 repeat protein
MAMTFLKKIKARIVDKLSGGLENQDIGTHLGSLIAEDRSYALKHLPQHMVEAGRSEQLYQWLTDFDFIEAKVSHPEINVQELIEDYELALHLDSLILSEKQNALKLIQGSLRLAAHILEDDAAQVTSQFLGRLQHFEHPDIQRLLKQIKRDRNSPNLHPQTASLTPPGGHLFRTLIGHTDAVNAVAITPDGKQIISASSDKTLIVWNWENGNKRFILADHTAPVQAIAITPDGKRVISASLDKTLKVWNLDNGQELKTLRRYNPLANNIVVTPNGMQVISPSLSKLTVWNLNTDEEFPILEDRYQEPVSNDLPKLYSSSIAITADGQWAISSSFYSFWVWVVESPGPARQCWENRVKLWNLDTQEEKFYFSKESFDNLFNSIVITADGLQAICSSSDSSIEVFDLKTEREIVQNKFKYWISHCLRDSKEYDFLKPLFRLNGHKDSIDTLAVTADGKRLISGAKDNILKVWDLATKTRILNFIGHSDRVNTVAISPDDRWIISGSSDCTLKIWNLETEAAESEADLTFVGHRDSVNAIAITPDGKQVISGSSEGKLIIWDGNTQQVLYSISNQKASVDCICLTPDAKQLIYSDRKGTIKIWNLDHRQTAISKIRKSQLAQSFVVSPDGKLLIILRNDGYCRFISLNRDRLTRSSSDRLHLKNNSDLFIKFKLENNLFQIDAEHKKIVFRCCDRKKQISLDRFQPWILAILSNIFYLYNRSSNTENVAKEMISSTVFSILCVLPLLPLALIDLHSDAIKTIVLIIVYLTIFTTMALLSVKLNESQGDSNINGMAIVPDSHYLCFAASDARIKLFNLENREQLPDFIGHDDSVETVAVAPNGQFIVSGSADKTIKIWSLETRENLFTLVGHRDTVNSVVVTPDSQRLISTSLDNSLKVWDLQTQQVIATFVGDSRINCCAVASDGVTIVAGESSGRVHFLRLENAGLM